MIFPFILKVWCTENLFEYCRHSFPARGENISILALLISYQDKLLLVNILIYHLMERSSSVDCIWEWVWGWLVCFSRKYDHLGDEDKRDNPRLTKRNVFVNCFNIREKYKNIKVLYCNKLPRKLLLNLFVICFDSIECYFIWSGDTLRNS